MMLVDPAPRSARHTPSSRSSARSTASAQARGSNTVSSTCTPARFTAVTTFCSGAGRDRDHVHAHFEPRRHHAQRIVDAGLVVENEFLRQQVKNFAIVGKRNGAGLVHRGAQFFAANFARARAEAQAAVAVDAAGVGPGHAQQGMLDRRSGHVFGLLHRLLNRADGFVQIHDDALARAARFGHAVAAIAQTVVGNFRHQRAGLGAAYVDCGQKMLVLVRHSYCVSPLAIAGLGFAAGLTAATDFSAGFWAAAFAVAPLRQALLLLCP